ncbi:hypothetical protein JCM10450v2_000738 [Rhodotorula kratochvilovae]
MLTKSSLLLALAAAATAAPAPSPPHLETRNNGKAAALPASHWKEARLTADGFTNDKWVQGFEKAKAVVAGLSLEQKLNFTALGADSGGCSARTYPLSDGSGAEPFQLCMADGPTGINSRYSTQFPAQVTTAATWSMDLFYARASALAAEYRAIGASVPLSIVVGPLGRGVYGGRNWEGFSPDPYLSGEAVRVTVEGFQDQGVTGLVKHFVGNEQEWLRIGAPQGGYFFSYINQTTDSIIDAATLREAYVWPFAEAVRAGAGSFMCSYNLLNGTSACESDELINQLLKQELNFHGWVLTDWGAGHTTAGTALNGTDWVASGSAAANLFGDQLGAFIKNGSIPAEIVDDKLIRMLTPYYALNQSSFPSIDFNRWVANTQSADVARKLSEESLTLLKNVRSANDTRGLPLNKPRDLLLVGSGAAPAPYGYISNLNSAVYYAPGNDYTGFNSDGLGSGGSPVPYAIDPLNAFIARGQKEETPVHVDYFAQDDPTAGWIFTAIGQNISYLESKLEYANTAIVFVTAVAMEGFDRTSLKLQNNGDELIKYVAERHNDTVVVITAPGPVDVSAWNNHENVTAVTYAYFSGQEGGHAIASVLFGDANPSGKLPFTIAKNVSDYDAGAHFNGSVSYQPKIKFDEGVFIDYKYFDQKDIEPLYEFGFGKSYSTFEISGLTVAANATKVSAPVRETNEKFFVNDEQASGLYDVAYTVTAQVANTGAVAGAEVAQLYLGFPTSTPNKMPARSLRGFAKPFLQPGANATVTFELRNKDLAVWDVTRDGWALPKGDFKLTLGSSSRDAAATATITV